MGDHYLTVTTSVHGTNTVIIACRCGWVKVTSITALLTDWRQHTAP